MESPLSERTLIVSSLPSSDTSATSATLKKKQKQKINKKKKRMFLVKGFTYPYDTAFIQY